MLRRSMKKLSMTPGPVCSRAAETPTLDLLHHPWSSKPPHNTQPAPSDIASEMIFHYQESEKNECYAYHDPIRFFPASAWTCRPPATLEGKKDNINAKSTSADR
jgi:hypothetical protein